jgi:hypothetical protein
LGQKYIAAAIGKALFVAETDNDYDEVSCTVETLDD